MADSWKKSWKYVCMAVLLATRPAPHAHAQVQPSTAPRSMNALPLEEAERVQLDGRLDEAFWTAHFPPATSFRSIPTTVVPPPTH
jgi:hypothetical protein